MTNTHQKNSSNLLVIMEIEIKPTKKYHNRPVSITKIKKQTNLKYQVMTKIYFIWNFHLLLAGK